MNWASILVLILPLLGDFNLYAIENQNWKSIDKAGQIEESIGTARIIAIAPAKKMAPYETKEPIEDLYRRLPALTGANAIILISRNVKGYSGYYIQIEKMTPN